MSDYLLQFVAGNLLVSSVLAAAAWLAQARLRRPMVAHLLWTLALIKLLTPPLFTVPVVPLPGEAANAPALAPTIHVDAAPTAADVAFDAGLPATTGWMPDIGSALGALWLCGSAIVLVWSLLRVARFQRLLRQSRTATPPALTAQLAALARRFELARVPALHLTTARLTPMVWWTGGRVQIYLPVAMADELPMDQLRWILAHEIGHVRRGDHLVRWIEWLTCVAFWWNPITWWARRNLRANEEVCCDALVLRTLQGSRHSYADSLLAAVEFLARPGLRPPAMASEINSGGFLQKRFEMIVSKTPVKTTPRWLQGAFAAAAALLMPLGVAYAQNPDVKAVAERLERAVKAGELSKQDMNQMLGTLKKSAARQNQQGRDEKRRGNQADQLKDRAEAMRRRLKSAVESGRVEASEARKILRERMAQLELEAAKVAEQADRRARDTSDRREAERRELIQRRRELQDRQRQLEMRARELVNKRDRQERDAQNARGAFQKARDQYEDVVRQLERAVKDGQLEREDMERKVESYRRKLAEMERKVQQNRRAVDTARTDRAESVRRRLEAAVKRGDLTEREAKQKWMDLGDARAAAEKKGSRRTRTDDIKKKLQDIRARLDKAVQSGDLSKKDAKAKWNAIRKDMAAQQKADRKAQADARKQRARVDELRIKELKARIEAAIESGDLTKEEAMKKWAAIKKEMAAEKKDRAKAERRRRGIR